MDHTRSDPARGGDVYVPAGRHRMIGRRDRARRQYCLYFQHRSAQLRLGARIFFQQIRQTARPPLRQHGADPLQLRTGHCSHLVVRL